MANCPMCGEVWNEEKCDSCNWREPMYGGSRDSGPLPFKRRRESKLKGPAGGARDEAVATVSERDRRASQSTGSLVQEIAAIAWTCLKECAEHYPPPVMCVKHQLEAEAAITKAEGK